MSDTFNPFSLTGKSILVTGATSGIGRCTAITCSKMGAKVVVTGRNEERLQETVASLSGEGHTAVAADITCGEDIARLVDKCPTLHGAVHCAGIGDRTLLKMVREKDIERVMKTNFDAPVLLQRALLKRRLLSQKPQ